MYPKYTFNRKYLCVFIIEKISLLGKMRILLKPFHQITNVCFIRIRKLVSRRYWILVNILFHFQSSFLSAYENSPEERLTIHEYD